MDRGKDNIYSQVRKSRGGGEKRAGKTLEELGKRKSNERMGKPKSNLNLGKTGGGGGGGGVGKCHRDRGGEVVTRRTRVLRWVVVRKGNSRLEGNKGDKTRNKSFNKGNKVRGGVKT